MAEKDSAENKMSEEECMHLLISAINRDAEVKFRGYKDGSKDLIVEATHSKIYEGYDNPIFSLSSYNIEVEDSLCCLLKHKLGKPKIKTLRELRKLILDIHIDETHYNKIEQDRKNVDNMLKELTEKLKGIGGVLDDLQLTDEKELDVLYVELKKQEILDLVKQKIGYSDSDVEKELSDMMNEILKLYRDVTYDCTITKIYTRMLFGAGEYKAGQSMEKLKKFGIVDDTHPLPVDYPLIENGIINTMDELLDIVSLFYNNKIYLCLGFYEFRKALIERIVGKEKLIEIIENAEEEQLKKLADLEASMSKDYRSYASMLQVFLASSQDSDKIQRVLNFVLEHENLTADVADDFRTNMSEFNVKENFYNNNIQISVDSFERLLNAKYKSQKEKIFCLTDDNLSELLELLEGGVKCCSEDMNKNNKKVDLKKIFDGVQIKLGKYLLDEYYLSKFINFVFANINKIKLDGLLMHFICSSFLTSYNKKIIKNKRLDVVIDAILKKQNFVYKDGSTMQQSFEAQCIKSGITTSCDQDDIFYVRKKLYLVDKDAGINQFDSLKNFFEYVRSNVNTPEGKRYFNLLMRLTDNENNIFLAEEKLYLVDKDAGIIKFNSLDHFIEYVYLNINTEKGERYTNYLSKFFDYNFNRYANSEWGTHIEAKINDDFCTVSNIDIGSISYYSLALISKILESQGETGSLSDKFENAHSEWNRWNGFDSFCFKFYMYVIFPLIKRFQSQPPQPKIINIDKVLQSKEINGNEISMAPESEISANQTEL